MELQWLVVPSLCLSIHPAQLGKPVGVISDVFYPKDVAVNSAGEIIIADYNGVSVFNKNGMLKCSCVYVVNTGKHKVSVFTMEGEYVTSFGQRGNGEGEFKYPWGVCVDKDVFVYVCDCNNNRVQILRNKR